MYFKKVFLGAVCLMCCWVTEGAVIYNNGGPSHASGSGITQNRSVDDFTLATAADVNGIRFWAVFDNNDSTGKFSGNVTWAIYDDAAGSVGSQVATDSVTGLSMTDTGNGGGSFNAYLIEFSIPTLTLGPGTYWLEVHEGTSLTEDDTSRVYWATAGFGGNAMSQSGGVAFPDNLLALSLDCTSCESALAFELDGISGVPEPATALLFAVGGIALVLIGHRRRK